ncbi:MAG: hypothetical protein Q9161_007470 [Pseudevernia consocians]
MSTGTLASLDGVTPRQYSERLDKDATVVPVGLQFGPTWISIAYSVDDVHYSTGIECNQVYRDFYEEALDKKVQSQFGFEGFSPSAEPLVPTKERASELVLDFTIHIENAWKEAICSLDENPKLNFKVMAITLPDHWDDSTRTVVAMAARKAGHPLDGSYMVLKLPRAVQLAYEMHKDAHGKYLTLLIHYHRSYLHLMLVEMCGTGYVVERQVCLRHLGEDEIKASIRGSATLNKTSPGGNLSYAVLNDRLIPGPSTSTHLTQDDTASGNDIYTEPSSDQRPPIDLKFIQEAVTVFILLTKPTDTSNPGGEHIKFIVIDGEASIKRTTALLTQVKEMFADTEGINVLGFLSDCGAEGAKVAARRQFQNPMHLGDWKDLPGYLPESAT